MRLSELNDLFREFFWDISFNGRYKMDSYEPLLYKHDDNVNLDLCSKYDIVVDVDCYGYMTGVV